MTSRRVNEVSFALVVVFGLVACGQNSTPRTQSLTDTSLLEHLSATGSMAHSMARAPVGAYLFARKGKHSCAIKFTQFGESKAPTSPTVFSDGAPSRYASYEITYTSAGKEDSVPTVWENAVGKVTSQSSIGIGRLAIARGRDSIDCGEFGLTWVYPVWVRFHPAEGVEFAITRIKDPKFVRFDAPELKWYGLDKSGNRQVVENAIESYCCETVNPN